MIRIKFTILSGKYPATVRNINLTLKHQFSRQISTRLVVFSVSNRKMKPLNRKLTQLITLRNELQTKKEFQEELNKLNLYISDLEAKENKDIIMN